MLPRQSGNDHQRLSVLDVDWRRQIVRVDAQLSHSLVVLEVTYLPLLENLPTDLGLPQPFIEVVDFLFGNLISQAGFPRRVRRFMIGHVGDEEVGVCAKVATVSGTPLFKQRSLPGCGDLRLLGLV